MAASDTHSFISTNFVLDQISLLIQLRYQLSRNQNYLVDPKDLEPLIKALGFDGKIVTNAMIDSVKYELDVKNRLNHSLESLQAAYQSAYDTRPLELDFDTIKQEMLSGVPSLKVQASLVDPFNILAVERHFRLPETGSYPLFIKNWNVFFYTPQGCEAYNHPRTCLRKAIEYGDFETFQRLYHLAKTGTEISTYLGEAIRHGRIEIVQYILDSGDNMQYLLQRRPILEAARTMYDNREMIKFLWSIPQVRQATVLYEQNIRGLIDTQGGINPVNLETILQLVPPSYDVSSLLPLVASRGWTRVFQLLVEAVEPSQAAWNDSFVRAASRGHRDMVELIRPHIDSGIDKFGIFIQALDMRSVDYQKYRYIMSMPEMENADIIRFLRSFRSMTGTITPELEDVALESGKVSQAEIDLLK